MVSVTPPYLLRHNSFTIALSLSRIRRVSRLPVDSNRISSTAEQNSNIKIKEKSSKRFMRLSRSLRHLSHSLGDQSPASLLLSLSLIPISCRAAALTSLFFLPVPHNLQLTQLLTAVTQFQGTSADCVLLCRTQSLLHLS